MAHITDKDVLKVASLSQLSLTDEEVKKYASEMSEILTYVEQLQAIDTEKVKPTYQVNHQSTVLRPDVIEKYDANGIELLKPAPSSTEDQFKVRKVL